MTMENLAGIYRDELVVILGRRRVQYDEEGYMEDILDEEDFVVYYLGDVNDVDDKTIKSILDSNFRSLAHKVE